MSDEALLIGQVKEEVAAAEAAQAQPPAGAGRSGIKVPTDIVDIPVFGVFSDDTAVQETFTVNRPRWGTKDVDMAQFLFMQVNARGGILTEGTQGEFNLYPVSAFKRLSVKLGQVAIAKGVNLA